MSTAPMRAHRDERAHRDVRATHDVYESDREYIVVAEMPGVEDVNIRLDKSRLVLEALRSSTGARYRVELELPLEVDAEGIDAKLTQGVLTVHLPKASGSHARRIHVTSDETPRWRQRLAQLRERWGRRR